MLLNILIYLSAAVISVPIAKRLGLGSVLGYLLAGVIIGPSALQLVGEQKDVMHFAEFGVVMMLFLIGLELHPKRLWDMRKPILGLGGLQVIITTTVIAVGLYLTLELAWQTSLAIGLTLALSSTAIVVQSLTERGLLKTQAGNKAFSVLLFQDIAIIPILAILPFLAINSVETGADSNATVDTHSLNLIEHLPLSLQIIASLMTIGVIVFGGKFLSAPMFRFIANTKLKEIFTAFALLIVIISAVLMQVIGLSPALGAFLAGVVLADSEFRHQIDANIEPFKELLLGLFFIAVGASINFQLFMEHPFVILTAVISLVAIKAGVLMLLAKLFSIGRRQALLLSIALAQGGEFAFMLVSTATDFMVFDQATGNMIIVVVALSMLISPLLIFLYEKLMSSPNQQATTQTEKQDAMEAAADKIPASDEVIIAGYGRFGQIVGRLLNAQGYSLTVLDHSPSQVDRVRRFGYKAYYGDASREDLLSAAGAAEAKLLVVAVDSADKAMEIIEVAKKHFPQLNLFVRAIDRRHAYTLMNMGIENFRRETFGSALDLGVDVLKALGKTEQQATRASTLFLQSDERSLIKLASIWGDEKSYGAALREREEELTRVLQADVAAKDQQEPVPASTP